MEQHPIIAIEANITFFQKYQAGLSTGIFVLGEQPAYFQVDLGNFYHVFNEIRLRKKNRTQLLDLLKEKVVAKMDELDIR